MLKWILTMKGLIKWIAIYVYSLLSVLRIILIIIPARIRNKNIVFLLATPVHSNLGDQAIAYAEKKFLEKHLQEYKLIETRLVHRKALTVELSLLSKLVRPNDVVFGHGGGNMGDQYPREEQVRRSIIYTFPENKIIIFPQTIYFGESASALQMLDDTKKLYSQHKMLTIIAREKESCKQMKKHFPNATVILTPDIVLSLRQYDSAAMVRRGSMTCLRKDVEKIIDETSDGRIIAILRNKFGSVNISDTLGSKRWTLTDRQRVKQLKSKWAEFKRAELVVTDRLHGMVFAAITGTPCVVFSNYNHKVAGTYEWIKELPNIQFCERIEDLESAIEAATAQPFKEVPRFTEYWESILKGIA